MITLERIEGITYPMIYCDFCGERIKDARNANYVWHLKKEAEFKTVHKKCDLIQEQKLRAEGKIDERYECSMELENFIMWLMYNTGIRDPLKAINRSKMMEMM